MAVHMRLGLVVCMVSVSLVIWSDGSSARDRVALALAGPDCPNLHHEMIETLERFEGVVDVQAEVIADHLLIDHDGNRTGEDLASALNGLSAMQGRCRAAVMQSCITASVGPRLLHTVRER